MSFSQLLPTYFTTTILLTAMLTFLGKVILGKTGSPQGFLCCAAIGPSFVIG